MLGVPEALEKIINTDILLINIDESVNSLRIGKYEEEGVKYSIIAPNNSLGKLGFEYYPVFKNGVRSIHNIKKNKTIFSLNAFEHIIICNNRRSWPRDIPYEQINIGDYFEAIGRYRAQKS